MSNKMILGGSSAARKDALPMALVGRDLEEVERIYQATLEPFRVRFGPIIAHLDHYRGKRLRPMLVLLAGHAVGGVKRQHHLLGAVVEMIHTATLVHDDVLDAAATRRHTATVNANWGNHASILLGDMLFSAAFKLCASVDARACEIIGETTNKVCSGELLQVTRAGRLDLSEAEYFEVIEGKTGVLTECATRLGARYAGASPEVEQDMADYGRHLGMAFQVADDVLDLRGDANRVGKTLGTDLAQRKMTLPLIRFFGSLGEAEDRRIKEMLSTHDHDSEVIARVIASGSVESAQMQADAMVRDAHNSLACLAPSNYRTALEQVARWAIRRDA